MLVEITFFAFAALTLVSAIMVLRVKELVHAAVWLAGMLLAIAGIFLTLGGEFLATIQVLVYIGAVITLILFTVMLTTPTEAKDPHELNLPPGVSVESVEFIQSGMPADTGVGPYKDLAETNPRKPLKQPKNLYGVTLADNEYATDMTPTTKGESK
ncbi:MAG TPA: NADH-quinone oxidoreductase subunit J [Candidatus Thermoplasmatota archaeon]|nr:NADH-quinone oxidoreductase subunit J [Candidatus Thermoplasmatota archaeon]